MEKNSWGPEYSAHPCPSDLHTVEARGGDTPDFKTRGLSKDIFGFEIFDSGFFLARPYRVRKFVRCFLVGLI